MLQTVVDKQTIPPHSHLQRVAHGLDLGGAEAAEAHDEVLVVQVFDKAGDRYDSSKSARRQVSFPLGRYAHAPDTTFQQPIWHGVTDRQRDERAHKTNKSRAQKETEVKQLLPLVSTCVCTCLHCVRVIKMTDIEIDRRALFVVNP